MTQMQDRIYEKRDSTERFIMTPYQGPESKYPHHKIWRATSQKTGKSELCSDQEVQLWYRVIPPPEA